MLKVCIEELEPVAEQKNAIYRKLIRTTFEDIFEDMIKLGKELCAKNCKSAIQKDEYVIFKSTGCELLFVGFAGDSLKESCYEKEYVIGDQITEIHNGNKGKNYTLSAFDIYSESPKFENFKKTAGWKERVEFGELVESGEYRFVSCIWLYKLFAEPKNLLYNIYDAVLQGGL